MGKLKPWETDFQAAINNGSQAFDFAYDSADAEAPAAAVPIGSQSARIKGNPNFVATFNLKFLKQYYTLTGGTYTKIAPSALNVGLQNALPFFIFGNNDFASGFPKLKGEFQINANWIYGVPFIFGKDEGNALGLDATVLGQLENGDMVQPFTSALPGAGTTTLALSIVRCPEIAYGSLLSELSSDRFVLNGIRYTINDLTKLDQYQNQIQFNNLSIFGKFDNDKLTPNDYKVPEQFQNGIIDIPLPPAVWGAIDKHKSYGFQSDYDVENQSWTLFSPRVNKLSA